MSEMEQAVRLLCKVPTYKMGYVLAYLQGITADEDDDDEFCEKMLENYMNNPDPEKGQTVTIEEAAKMLGVEL